MQCQNGKMIWIRSGMREANDTDPDTGRWNGMDPVYWLEKLCESRSGIRAGKIMQNDKDSDQGCG